MENESSAAVLPGILAAILSLLEIIFIPGMIFKVIALILTCLAGNAYLFFIMRDFSEHFNYLAISYSGFGVLLFLTDMGWIVTSIEKQALFAAVLVNFIVTALFCWIAALIMRETQRNLFGDFFLGENVILGLSLVLFYIYWFGRFNVDHSMTARVARFVPFATLADFIEKMIYGQITFGVFGRYLAYSILIYVPFGYLVGILGQRLHTVTEILLILVMPVLMELVQLVFVLNGCDIDDMIFGFLGGLIGIGLFNILNLWSLVAAGASLTGEEKRMEE